MHFWKACIFLKHQAYATTFCSALVILRHPTRNVSSRQKSLLYRNTCYLEAATSMRLFRLGSLTKAT